MQHRITKPSDLLNKCGKLIQKGYATKPLLHYHRKNVAFKCRLKEWDYYLVYNNKYAVALTVGKIKYLAVISATLIDFSTKKSFSKTVVKFMSARKFTMPESSETGDITIKTNKLNLSICNHECSRQLYLLMKGASGKCDLEISLTLSQEPNDSMIIALPFKQCNKLFYFSRKIIGMDASGYAKLGNETYCFSSVNSYGLLNWGRSAFPLHTDWFWAAAQGRICGYRFGFNLAAGLADTSYATENMLFYKGTASKLYDVSFVIPKTKKGYQYMKPWKIYSSDKRIELKFTPILERKGKLCTLLFSCTHHQVFGIFSGCATLDDGTIVLINDFPGFVSNITTRC